jgi:hypothetical protein
MSPSARDGLAATVAYVAICVYIAATMSVLDTMATARPDWPVPWPRQLSRSIYDRRLGSRSSVPGRDRLLSFLYLIHSICSAKGTGTCR